VLDQTIDTLISTHFGRFKVLEEYFGNLIRIQVGICKARSQDAVKIALDLETVPHYTQNTHYLQILREKWLALYRTVRSRPVRYKAPIRHNGKKKASKPPQSGPPNLFPPIAVECVETKKECLPLPVSEWKGGKSCGNNNPEKPDSSWFHHSKSNCLGVDINPPPPFKEGFICDGWSKDNGPGTPGGAVSETPEAKALRALADAGYAGLCVSDLARLLPPDSFEEELVVMADVRAYYHVAYKRIIDHIPFTIEHALHHALAKQLSQSLLTSLLTDAASGSNFSERMKELVSEDASIAQKRLMLSTRKERLLNIRRRLMTFSNSI
jgi:hypothetical protein